MITRVRGRLRSLHTLPKLDPEVREEKIAETGENRVFQIIINNFFTMILLLINFVQCLYIKIYILKI